MFNIPENDIQIFFENLFNSLEEGLVICDVLLQKDNKMSYVIKYINITFEKIFGVKKDALMEKSILEVYPELDPQWLTVFRNVIEKENSTEATNRSKFLISM